ncbi:MAG: esterase-like activity of phytase family protein, partial [Bacteroidota bacterium]
MHFKLFVLLLLSILSFSCTKKETKPPIEKDIVELKLLGEFVLPSNADTSGTRVGGLSSID